MPRKSPPPPAKPRPAARTGEDAALWDHVARSVTPLKGAARAKLKGDETPAKKTAAPKGKPAATRMQPLPPPLPAKNKPPAPPAAGFDRSTQTKLARGQLPLDGRIDLHGMTQTQAHAALARFIATARRREWRTLLVITGKGRVSEGGGVLRRLLPLWLQEEPFRAHVLALTPAQQKDGGNGAFYLRLRKAKD